KWHGRLSFDHDLNGVQKIHDTPVPRIGGVGVIVGLILAGLFSYHIGGETYETAAKLLLCGLPAFAAGLIEDFTKKVGVRPRLFASFISAALAYWLLGAKLTDLDTPGLNLLMQFSLVSFLFTCFAVGGLTNAINIIDGLNGLASGSVAIMLGGLATIAWMQGDLLVMKLCLWGIAATVGFLLLNYPFGRIFLGDGGAYLAGFWLAECAVLLLQRNPKVSTWAVLLVVIYPAWETVYSMMRRHARHVKSGAPDQTHLHHLLYKTASKSNNQSKSWLTHGLVSFEIWVLILLCQVAAIYSKNQSLLSSACTVAFAGIYIFTYRSSSKSSTNNHQIDVDAVTY
ncbi:MAG TPA: glycosyltransferase, partial [Pseudomonadales bacterium]|nr:glycosyltransferase [Pseudomonadales bacterium]